MSVSLLHVTDHHWDLHRNAISVESSIILEKLPRLLRLDTWLFGALGRDWEVWLAATGSLNLLDGWISACRNGTAQVRLQFRQLIAIQ